MKKAYALLIFLFALAVPLQAQTPTPQQSSLNLSVGSSMLGSVGSGQADPGTDIILSLPATPKTNFQLRSDNYLIPSCTLPDGKSGSCQGYLVGFKYPPGFLIKLLAKTSFAGAEPYIHAGAGASRVVPVSGTNKVGFGWSAGLGLDWNFKNGVSTNLGEYSRLCLPGYGCKNAIAGGIGFIFGKH